MSDTFSTQAPPAAPAPSVEVDTSVDPQAIQKKIDAMNTLEVEQRRNEIIAAAKGNYEDLNDTQLHELACIAMRLRRTNVGPPKEKKKPAAKASKNIDDFL